MPSVISGGPFLSVQPDESCGRHNGASKLSNGYSNGYANGYSKEHHDDEDGFLKLAKPQQDILLLHGPRQKYSLEEARDIPDLHNERELLVQVLAIALNPVDWKVNDYGFGQPSYPWVSALDTARTGASSATMLICPRRKR